ncbi:MAG TPA: type II toxin-antitoxin system prevent-host-death family antitoxin [Candidatus Binataceae bacterium]|nr:type II toxin-antitoxin system prevent-host-death family antitoxin [Candidatus Binataceae bacterium]
MTSVSKLKATCLAVVERVRKTRKPIVITKFGKPVAQISPLAPMRTEKAGGSWLGSMAGTGRIIGDIIEPAVPLEDYDAFKYPAAVI